MDFPFWIFLGVRYFYFVRSSMLFGVLSIFLFDIVPELQKCEHLAWQEKKNNQKESLSYPDTPNK